MNILGYDFEVCFVDKSDKRLDNKLDGRVLYNDFQIVVDKNLNPIMLKEVLTHEVTHALLCVQGRVYQKKFDVEEVCELVGYWGEKISAMVEKELLEIKVETL